MIGFKDLSIRARFAYSLKCTSNYISHFQVERELSEQIVQEYSLFTSERNLNDWFFQCKEYSPMIYLKITEESDFELFHKIPRELARRLDIYYRSVNPAVAKLFEITFDIGIEHLYSVVNSENTLQMLDEAINILIRDNIELPDWRKLEFSSFSQFEGWGDEFIWKEVWL